MTNRIASLIILCLLGLLPSSSIAESQPAPKYLRIGAVLSLSGDAGNHGDAIRKGVSLAADELRGKGWTVDINFQDDGTNPAKTISALQFLLAQDYRVFIGPTWSFLINTARPVLEKAGAVAIVPAGSSDINGGPSEAIFSLCPARAGELPHIVSFLKSRPYKRAFVLTPLGDWGVVHREVFLKAAKEAGVEVTADEQFDYGIDPAAMKTILLRAKNKGADLVLTTAGASDIATMLKARRDLQWKSGLLTTENLWDTVDMGLISEKSPELKDSWVIGLPLVSSFYKKYQERYQEGPKMYSDRAYDALMLLAKATEATDGTPTAIRKFLKGLTDFQGVTGKIEFTEAGDKKSEDYRIMAAFNNKSRT